MRWRTPAGVALATLTVTLAGAVGLVRANAGHPHHGQYGGALSPHPGATQPRVSTTSPAAVVAPAITAPSPTTPRTPAPGSLQLYRVDRPEDGSGPHDVWVYRPAVPESANLPVVYFLHGGPGSGQDVFRVGMAAQLDAYVASGGTPFILAAPDGNGVSHPDADWADDADGRDRIETWLTTDVIAAVEGDAVRDREHRAITGFSMGGYGAMNIALRHPDLYSQVVSIAGFFHAQDYEGVFAGNPSLETANSPDANLGVLPFPRVLLMDGAQDSEPAVTGETQRFAGLLDARHLPVQLVVAPGQHDWDYVATQLPAVLAFLGRGFASGPGHAPG